MNRGKAGFDRFITFLLFLVFAGLATWGIGLAVDWDVAHRIGEYADRDFWAGLPDRENYDNILRITSLVLFVLGLVLLAIAAGSRLPLGSMSPASSMTGTAARVTMNAGMPLLRMSASSTTRNRAAKPIAMRP